jgi:hypothetical protein
MGDDLSHGRGPLVPPEVYRQHVFPWGKRVAGLAHSHGMPFGLHSCGNNTAIMEGLINDVNIDAKHSFQDGMESVVDFKRRCGDRVAVLGGIDMGCLATMMVEEFRPWCQGVLASCMEGGGHALGTGNSPATYMRLENFFAMHEVDFAHGRSGLPPPLQSIASAGPARPTPVRPAQCALPGDRYVESIDRIVELPASGDDALAHTMTTPTPVLLAQSPVTQFRSLLSALVFTRASSPPFQDQSGLPARIKLPFIRGCLPTRTTRGHL